jgi:hypothetical protein
VAFVVWAEAYASFGNPIARGQVAFAILVDGVILPWPIHGLNIWQLVFLVFDALLVVVFDLLGTVRNTSHGPAPRNVRATAQARSSSSSITNAAPLRGAAATRRLRKRESEQT